MSFVAIAIGGSALIGGAVALKSGDKATKAVTQAADKTDATNRYIYDTSRADNEPWRQTGVNALGKLASMYGVQGPSSVGGSMSGTEAPQPYGGFQTSPGYQFRVDEATKAIERSAAARGDLRSGATMDALQRRVQGEASNEYERYADHLASLAGIGQSATNANTQAGQVYASQQGANNATAGNARASAYQNTGNAINSSLQGVGQAFLYNRGFGGGGFDPYAKGYEFGPAG